MLKPWLMHFEQLPCFLKTRFHKHSIDLTAFHMLLIWLAIHQLQGRLTQKQTLCYHVFFLHKSRMNRVNIMPYYMGLET